MSDKLRLAPDITIAGESGRSWVFESAGPGGFVSLCGVSDLPSKPLCRKLEKAARAAAGHSYSPYSRFPVGSAILCASGKIYSGCNVENASYGLCNCAERTAIFSAIAAGEKSVEAVVVYTPTPQPTTPCGACRQVLNEFGPTMAVLSICDGPERLETSLDKLLPHAFGPKNLEDRPKAKKRR